jgi:glycosyltransferase involved in cell wall biosynthesis
MKRRVVHVVGRMHRAGIETWLMQVIRRFEGLPVRHDFLVHTQEEAAYDAELAARGCRIYRVAGKRRRLSYPAALDAAFGEALADGPIDAVHAHEQLWCGVILEAAARAGIRKRIAHSHNDTLGLERFPNLHRIVFGAWMRRRIGGAMTHGLSCSALAAPSLFGPAWRNDARVALHYYGLDFERFRRPEETARVRHALGIPAGRKVIGHVGRCEPQKNQAFLLDILRQALRHRSDLHLLLIGEGALEQTLREYIAAKDLAGNVTWLRNRSDIPALMVSAMDVFALPSLHEGLPLALLEAQAAGLPCLYSSEITGEANLYPATNATLSHRRAAGEWVRELLRLVRLERPPRGGRIDRLSAGPFSVAESVRALAGLYDVEAANAAPARQEEVCR